MENKTFNNVLKILAIFIVTVAIAIIISYSIEYSKINEVKKSYSEFKKSYSELEIKYEEVVKKLELYEKNEIKKSSNTLYEEMVEKKVDNSKYNVNDYVSVTNHKTFDNLTKIEFKELPLRTFTEFKTYHDHFIQTAENRLYNPKIYGNIVASNEINYEVYKNILSVYTKESNSSYEDYYVDSEENYYSLNIDLNNNKIVTNEELLNICNINSTDMFEKILNNISNTVTTENFLLSTTGDVNAETETIDKFKENIKTYVTYIDNRYDIVTLYLKDNKLIAVYDQQEILSILGMGTHMGVGLDHSPQSIQLN